MRQHADRVWIPIQAKRYINLQPCHELVTVGGTKCRRDIADWITEVEGEHSSLRNRSKWTEGDKWR